MFFTHKLFCIENLNLNLEKNLIKLLNISNTNVMSTHQSNTFFPPSLELSADKETEHVDKAM